MMIKPFPFSVPPHKNPPFYLLMGSFSLLLFLILKPNVSLSLPSSPPSLLYSLKTPFSSKKAINMALHFNHISFFEGSGTSFQNNQWGDHLATFGFDINYSGNFKYWKSYVDLTHFYSFVESTSYLHARDVYSFSQWSHVHLTIGRRQYPWSLGDHFWKQGLWQPRFRWNKIQSQSQGLAGLFLDNLSHNKAFRFFFFYSPIFIPEAGPVFRVKDGQLISKNPWFSPLQKQVIVQGDSHKDIHLDIHHHLLPTQRKEVVFNQGTGLNLEWISTHGTFFSFSYAYKPFNQFIEAMGAPFIRMDDGSQTATLEVPVAPRLIYHHLAALEIGKEKLKKEKDPSHQGAWNYWVSLNYEKPINQSDLGHENLFQNGAFQVIEDSFFSSFYLSYDWEYHSKKTSRLYLGYAKLWKGQSSSQGNPTLKKAGLKFNEHYQYKNAIRVGFTKSHLRILKKSISSQLQLTYDLFFKGVLCEANLHIPFFSDFIFILNSSLIGVLESNNKSSSSFFDRYKISDYIKMSLKYVF